MKKIRILDVAQSENCIIHRGLFHGKCFAFGDYYDKTMFVCWDCYRDMKYKEEINGKSKYKFF